MEELDPQYGPAYHNLAIAEGALGHHDEALRHVEAALKLQPDNPGFIRVRGQIHASRGDVQAALTDLRTVIDIADDDEQWEGDKERAQQLVTELETTGQATAFEPCR